MDYTKQIAEILVEKNAVKVSTNPPFTWTSGIKSPIYCDNRKLISHPDACVEVVKGFMDVIMAQGLDFDYVAGTATAGIPWAAFLATQLNVPMVYVRSEAKGHGAGKQVEGDGEALREKRVLVIEDLISTGGSSITTVKALQSELEAEVVGVLAIFQYGFAKANEAFAEIGMPFYSLSNFETLLELLKERGEVENVGDILKFAENPADWFENFNK